MKNYVIEVGPGTVRGPCAVGANAVSTALQCVDDDLALVDDRPVAVQALWRAVFRSALPDRMATAVLVCPTWWPPARIDTVRTAAQAVASNVVVLQRASVLTRDALGAAAVVEIADDFVVVCRDGEVVTAHARIGEPADIADAIARGLDAGTSVYVDAPLGVEDGAELGRIVSERLKADGFDVTTVHRDRVLEPSRERRPWDTEPRAWRQRSRAGALGAVVAVSLGVVCGGLALASGRDDADGLPMTILVEGQVGVKVPAMWAVRRITTGNGSARVQATAPDDTTAVLVTQAKVRKGESLADTAAVIRRALDDEQAGVFDRFDPDDRRADRPAATYRESRGTRQIDWVVFVDGAVRIAVGCQSAAGQQDVVRLACDEAVRSAHAIF
jgi:type VII secretion-associated protein (TIGR03931 family)